MAWSCGVLCGILLFEDLEKAFICWFCGDYMVNLVKSDNLLTLFNKTFFFIAKLFAIVCAGRYICNVF